MTSNKKLRERGTREQRKELQKRLLAENVREKKPTKLNTKLQKYPQAPAPLMDLVSTFLHEHGYADAARRLKLETQQREAVDGMTVPLSFKGAAGGYPTLTKLFNQWEAKERGNGAENTLTPESNDVDMESASSSESSDSDSESSSDSSSDSSSGSEDVIVKEQSVSKQQSRKRSATPASSTSSSDSSSSDSDSESEAEDAPPTKKIRISKAASASSSSSSSSEESSSESEAETSPSKQPLPESAETSDASSSSSLSDSESAASDSDSSSSDSSSGSEDVEDETESKVNESTTRDGSYDRKISSDSSATLPLEPIPDTLAGSKRKRSDQKTPKKDHVKERFQRVPETTQVDPRFASNEYVSYNYADRAYADLAPTRGKGFTKEKNKKKRGSYRGGTIDTMGAKGIKFED